MTQEEKELLFIDLCGRLSHGVMVSVQGGEFESHKYPYLLTAVSKFGLDCLCKVYNPIYTPFGTPKVEDIKPYLRPMSSMTEEERDEYRKAIDKDFAILEDSLNAPISYKYADGTVVRDRVLFNEVDWLNKNMFDYRGLIPMGLALEAKEGMYKTE